MLQGMILHTVVKFAKSWKELRQIQSFFGIAWGSHEMDVKSFGTSDIMWLAIFFFRVPFPLQDLVLDTVVKFAKSWKEWKQIQSFFGIVWESVEVDVKSFGTSDIMCLAIFFFWVRLHAAGYDFAYCGT